MMRLLAAVLLSMAFLTMGPWATASAPATPNGVAKALSAVPFPADAFASGCRGGHPCLPSCGACPLAPGSPARKEFPTVPATDRGTRSFADFDLSWRLYRPPKVG